MTCLVGFFGLFLFVTLCFLYLYVFLFNQVREVCRHYFFKMCSQFFALSPSDSLIMQILLSLMVFQRSLKLSLFCSYFFVFILIVFSVTLSTISLIWSSASSKPMSIPSSLLSIFRYCIIHFWFFRVSTSFLCYLFTKFSLSTSILPLSFLSIPKIFSFNFIYS